MFGLDKFVPPGDAGSTLLRKKETREGNRLKTKKRRGRKNEEKFSTTRWHCKASYLTSGRRPACLVTLSKKRKRKTSSIVNGVS